VSGGVKARVMIERLRMGNVGGSIIVVEKDRLATGRRTVDLAERQVGSIAQL